MSPNPDETDIPGVVGRRSARLSIIVPITVHGTDATGQAFKENTWTISVNQHGGRIATFHRLAVDEQVSIENPLLGRSAKGRVNRVCEKRFAEDPYEVCIELLEAQNVWGVKLPPEDWERERQASAGEAEGSSPRAEARTEGSAAGTPDEGPKLEAGRLAPSTSPEAGEQNGGLSQFNMAVHALSRFAGEAGAPPAEPAPPQAEALAAPAAPVDQARAEALRALESLNERTSAAESVKGELVALMDRVQAARADLESLLSSLIRQGEEFKAQIESERKSHEESARQNFATLRQEIRAEIQNAGTQARQICKEESGTAVKAISVCVDSAVDLLNRAGDDATARLLGVRQTLEASVKRAEEGIQRLAGESTSVLDKFRAEAEASATQLQSNLESAAHELTVRARSEISEKLDASVEAALESVVKEFNKHAGDAGELLKESVQSYREQYVEETQKQLAALRESMLGTLESEAAEKLARHREELKSALAEVQAQQATEVAALLESLRGTIQTAQDKCVDETQKQLGALRETALSSMESEAAEKSAQHREQLRSALAEVQAQQAKEMEAGVRASMEGLLESLRGTIQTAQDQCVAETQKQLGALRETARSSMESEAAEKSAQHREQLRGALVEMQAQQTTRIGTAIQATLQSLMESLHVRIQSTEEECAKATQKRLAALHQTTLSALESEAAAKSALYSEQLRSALLEVQAQQTREMETGLQGNLQSMLESLRTRIQSTADEAAVRVAAEIKNGAEQALQEIPERLSKSLGLAALMASEWAEQAKTELESHSSQLAEVFDKRLEAASAAAHKRQRSEAEAFIKGMLRSFQIQPEAVAPEAKTAAKEDLGGPPSPPPRPPSHLPPTSVETPAERQHRIVEEALNTFRVRLGQALASPPP